MKLTPRLALMLTMPPLTWAGHAVVGRLARDALRWALATPFAAIVSAVLIAAGIAVSPR